MESRAMGFRRCIPNSLLNRSRRLFTTLRITDARNTALSESASCTPRRTAGAPKRRQQGLRTGARNGFRRRKFFVEPDDTPFDLYLLSSGGNSWNLSLITGLLRRTTRRDSMILPQRDSESFRSACTETP